MPPARLRNDLPTAAAAAAEPPSPPVRVAIANETETLVDVDRLEAIVRAAIARAKFKSASISVAIVDDPTIHRLNRQFLEHDYPTDVLSFALAEPPYLEGEIIASIDTARREAAAVGWPAEDELALYAAHGALHLAGYLDEEPADAAAMRIAERAALAAVGITASSSDPRWNAAAADLAGEGPAT